MEIRTTKPEKGNKYYITKSSGGWSPCVKGKPTDKDCNVLCNCVGFAIGRFNEISNAGKIKYFTSMNAENFYANAYKWGLKTGQEPKQGAIMCWSKGKPGVSSDGAGHVAVVEKVNSSTSVMTSESGWNSFAFKNKTRTKGSNGQWGVNSSYHFLGFIYNPDVKPEPKPESPKPKPVDNFKVGDVVVPTKLVDYRGHKLRQYDKTYVISSIDKRGCVLRAIRGTQRPIWAVLPKENIKKV